MTAGKAVDYKVGADAQKAIDELSKMNAKLQESVEGLKNADKEGKNAGGALDGLVSKVGGMISLGAAIGGVATMLNQVEADAQAAFDTIEAAIASTKKLLQISPTTEDLEGFKKTTTEIQLSTGLSRELSSSILFDVLSAGGTQQGGKEAAGVFAIEEEPQAVAAAVFNLRGLNEQFGSVAELINLLGEAAGGANAQIGSLAAVTIDPLKTALAKGAQGDPATIIEEMLAVIGGATVGSPSPEKTRTQVQAFLNVMGTQGMFAGQGVMDTIRDFAGMSESERAGILGSNQEAATGGMSVLLRMNQIEATTAKLAEARALTGTGDSYLATRLEIASLDPELATVAGSRRAAQALAVQQEADALFEGRQESVETAAKALILRESPGAGGHVTNALVQTVLEFQDRFGVSPETMAKTATFLATGSPHDAPHDPKARMFFQNLYGILGEGGVEKGRKVDEAILQLDETNRAILLTNLNQERAARQAANNSAAVVTNPGVNPVVDVSSEAPE